MLYKRNPQLNKNGELIHLLSIEGLPKDILTHILDTAANFASVSDREVKKVPLLRGKSVFNLFFENSHAHPHHLRDRGQAAVGRRDQPGHRALLGHQGRVAARHHRQPVARWRPTCSWCGTANRARPT